MRKKKKGGFGCVCKETQNLKLRWWKRIKFEYTLDNQITQVQLSHNLKTNTLIFFKTSLTLSHL